MTGKRSHEDAVADQLERRLARAIGDARRLLGEPAGGAAPEDRETVLARLIAALQERAAGELDATASEAHARELERLDRRFRERFDALARIEEALVRLSAITAPSTLLSRAPMELCRSSRLTRAVLSVVRDGLVIPHAAHFRDDAVGAARAVEHLGAAQVRLEHPLLEAELLRRRRASIVTDAHVHPRVNRHWSQVMRWHSYVAAPLVVGGEVIGVIHADTGGDGRPLDVLDGDLAWTFARGLADAYETSSLRRALRRQRVEMRDFVEWLSARSSELSDASIEFVPERPDPPPPPGELDVVAAGAGRDDRVAFEGLLTRRELDVLRLLVRGQTNAAIAAQLVISPATVKFHVLNLLRKLHVSNRAEAVSRYHQLVRLRGEQP